MDATAELAMLDILAIGQLPDGWLGDADQARAREFCQRNSIAVRTYHQSEVKVADTRIQSTVAAAAAAKVPLVLLLWRSAGVAHPQEPGQLFIGDIPADVAALAISVPGEYVAPSHLDEILDVIAESVRSTSCVVGESFHYRLQRLADIRIPHVVGSRDVQRLEFAGILVALLAGVGVDELAKLHFGTHEAHLSLMQASNDSIDPPTLAEQVRTTMLRYQQPKTDAAT